MAITPMSLETRLPYVTRCDRCSSCKWVPGMPSQRFASTCPSIEYGQLHSYSGSGKSITAYALMTKRLDYSDKMLDSIYACTACGACDTACKWNHADIIDPLDTIYALRAQVVTDGKQLPAHATLIDAIHKHGNRYGLPREHRSQWARDLGIKNSLRERTDVLLHVGCENAYQQSQWNELRYAASLLKAARVDFGILYDEEIDTGSLAYDIGFQEDAKRSAQSNVDLIRRTQATSVITCSAEGYAAFQNIYPRLGVSLGAVKMTHIVAAIEELLAVKRLSIAASARQTVTYHDSCKLGRLSEPYTPWQGRWTKALNQINVTEPAKPVPFGNDGLYAVPRRLLGRIDNATQVEMQRTRQFSYCCGAGGGAKEAYPAFARHAASERLQEAQATGASVLISACGNCTVHLRQIASETGATVKVQGLLEYVAQASKAAVEQPA
jgi:Fe-S oxidoreductase